MTYRRALRRGIEDGRAVAWKSPVNPLGILGVNPSVALPDFTSDKDNDNTVRSIARIAAFNGFDAFILGNVSPFVATDPNDLITAINSGVDVWDAAKNDGVLWALASKCEVVVCAWGAAPLKHKLLERRTSEVRALLLDAKGTLHCLGRTKDGWPRHALYMPTHTPIQVFANRAPIDRPALAGEG